MVEFEVSQEFCEAIQKSQKNSYKKGYPDGYNRAYSKFHGDLIDMIIRHKPGAITVDTRSKPLRMISNKQFVIDEEFYVVE